MIFEGASWSYQKLNGQVKKLTNGSKQFGIGIGKRKFMELEHGQSYHLMRQIKELIDHKGLLNLAKIFI